MGPYRVPKRSIYLGPDLDSAVVEYLVANGMEFNTLVRAAIAQAIGKPELGQAVKMGRPAVAPVKASPPKKNAPRKTKRDH